MLEMKRMAKLTIRDYLRILICVLSIYILALFVSKPVYAGVVRSPCDAGTPSSFCYDDPNVSWNNPPKCPSGSYSATADSCKQTCTKYGCSQYICCVSSYSGPTCASIGGYCNSQLNCRAGYVYNGNDLNCANQAGSNGCCVPKTCGDPSI